MTKREKNILIGCLLVAGAVAVLTDSHCKGLLRNIASQLESIGVGDVLAGLFG
jgi:hypothetical protein